MAEAGSVTPGGSGLVLVEQGEWAGWRQWLPGDPFEDHAGPFYAREEAGGMVCGFRPGAQHCNGFGIVHGGALLTFADYALFVMANQGPEPVHGVTVTLNSEFVGAGQRDTLLLARGEVVRAGDSLIFLRGTISCDDAPVLAFSGTIKRLRRRG